MADVQNQVDEQVEQEVAASAAAVADAVTDLNQATADEKVAQAEESSDPAPATEPSDDATVPAPITDDQAEPEADDAKADEPKESPSILSDVQAATASVEEAKAAGSGEDEELVAVKKQALEQLAPLIVKLDLPPQEKFDTLMSIIRAGDDKSLVKPAFDAAQQIEDEDKKAQALLDVVNEVNYLTHADEESEEKEA